MWNKGWDNIFNENEWGKYPPEELIRFISRNFGKVNEKANISILEVGCGPGANIWFLSREGFNTFGIDGSKIAIDKAKKRLKRERLKAELLVGDILKLPFSNEKFDCVIDMECLYANSLKDSKLIIKDVERILKPEGLFLSKTFMAGTYRGVLRKGHGIARLASESDISDLYGCFDIINMDYLIRSEKNRSYEIKEWLITCKKKGGKSV